MNMMTSVELNNIIAVLAILSIVVGTLAALNQRNAKRMMAYSSVAQAGIMLAAISVGDPHPLFFYVIVFAVMNYVVFIVIHARERSGGGTALADFNGIGYTNPLAAVAATLGLVSLVGLPPMAGFMAKLYVFTAIWSRFSSHQNPVFLTLFVVGLLATAASLYFYLKIPFYAFFRRGEGDQPIKISLPINLLLLILVGLLLALFLAPGLVDGLV
jgi:NADH-quinone oxidoreductase subunit N